MADHTPSAVSLAEAVAAGVPPTWTEAVSLVREVARQLAKRGPDAPVPSDAQILVLPTGVVQLAGGSEHPAGPIVAVGSLLGQFLDDVVRPQGLIEVQQEAILFPPPYQDLQAFIRALEPWAQRDPKGELAGYYNRVTRAIEDAEPAALGPSSDPRETASTAATASRARRRRGRGAAPHAGLMPHWAPGMAWLPRPSGRTLVAVVIVVIALGTLSTQSGRRWVRRSAVAVGSVGRSVTSAIFGPEPAPAPAAKPADAPRKRQPRAPSRPAVPQTSRPS